MTSCQCVLLTSGGVCLLDATAAYTAPVTTTITTTTAATRTGRRGSRARAAAAAAAATPATAAVGIPDGVRICCPESVCGADREGIAAAASVTADAVEEVPLAEQQETPPPSTSHQRLWAWTVPLLGGTTAEWRYSAK